MVTAPRRKRRSFRGLTPRLQPESQNVQRGVMIPILFHPAAGTGIQPVRQRHFLPVSAGGTGLGRIGRIHPPKLPTGTLSLVREKEKELRPRRITEASIQASMGVHFIDGDIFDKNPSVLVDDLAGMPVGEIRPSERDTFMDFRHDLFGSFPFGRSCLLTLQFPLCLSDSLGRAFQKLRIFEDRPVRKGGERFHADIDSHRKGSGGKNRFRNVLAGKCRPPLSGGRPENGARLDFPFDRTMKNNRNGPDLRQTKSVSGQIASAVPLRVGDRGVLAGSLESGGSGVFPVLRSPEKSLKRQIDPNGDVLERLRIDRCKGGSILFQGGKRSNLVVQRQSDPIPLPRILPVFQKMVIEPSALFPLPVQERFLFSGRIQPILECASHIVHCFTSCTNFQPSNHALYPRTEVRGLTALFDKRGPHPQKPRFRENQ